LSGINTNAADAPASEERMPVTQELPIGGTPAVDADGRVAVVPPAERSRRRARWMALAQHGDGSAYRALLDDLGPQLTRFLRRRLRDREDLADAYQDTFLALHRARHTYRPLRPIEPWLFAIARNVAADYGRRLQRRTRYGMLTENTPDRGTEPTREMGTELDNALRALPNLQREALQLLKFQGLSIREAAARVGTTPGAVKLRAHRAYLALKAAFRT
jgi:RNA polymerase sigma-70 factor (ECF subfamily)